MNIILFGPPGVGKSTLIGVLKTLGQRAIDLEDLYPNKMRYQINNLVDQTFLGAADLSPKRKYSNAKKVLLSMDQKTYESRRTQRDSQIPGKKNQKTHLITDWLQDTEYDWIVDCSPNPQQVASVLVSLMKGEKYVSEK